MSLPAIQPVPAFLPGRLLFAIGGFVSLSACGIISTGTSTEQVSTICGTDMHAGVQGVDVSKYQGAFDWNAAHAQGVQFGFASVGDGFDPNPYFAVDWANMRAAGVLRGAYQFFEPGEDEVAQANEVIAATGALGDGDLPAAIDVEVTGGQPPAVIAAKVRHWIDLVRAGTGKQPIIYTGPYFWEDNVGDAFGDIALWVADYGPSCPLVPGGWGGWQIWQYDDDGGNLDLDVFNGSIDDLRALAGGPRAPESRISPVVAAPNASGGLDVFVHAVDDQLWVDSDTTGAWTGFAPMTGNMRSSPAVASNQDGRVEVFVRGSDNQLWHQWQWTVPTSANPSGTWSGFYPMTGNMTDSPAAIMNADGRLEVFVRGSDGELWHQWQSTPGGTWSRFWPMQGQMTGSPAVARNADGRLEAFVRGQDGELWHQYQVTPGGGWSGFAPMQGQITDSPAVTAYADGRLAVFVRGQDGQVWYQEQSFIGWTGFSPLTGSILGTPAAARNSDGTLEACVRGSDSNLWCMKQNPNGTWPGFELIGGPISDTPFIATNASGTLEIFVRGTDWQMWHEWQATPSGAWAGFWPLGGQLAP